MQISIAKSVPNNKKFDKKKPLKFKTFQERKINSDLKLKKKARSKETDFEFDFETNEDHNFEMEDIPEVD